MGVQQDDAVAIIGAGQHGRVVASILEAAGVPVAGHFDDDDSAWGTMLGRVPVVGGLDLIEQGSRAIVGIGDNEARRAITEQLDLTWVTAIHPFSWVHPDTVVGPGTVVCPGVTVQVGASVGSHVILNNRMGVGHDSHVGDFAHLTAGHLGGEAHVEEGAFMGIGSMVLPRVRVGAWAIVGAGAVVLSDVQPGATVVGNPARKIRPSGASARSTTD